MVFIVIAVVGGIVLLAIRIILGWVLPRDAMKAADKAFDRTMMFLIKLSVVAIAGVIVFGIYWVYTHPS